MWICIRINVGEDYMRTMGISRLCGLGGSYKWGKKSRWVKKGSN